MNESSRTVKILRSLTRKSIKGLNLATRVHKPKNLYDRRKARQEFDKERRKYEGRRNEDYEHW